MIDTIYALASARGVGGVAVIRVSGPLAISGYLTLTEKESAPSRIAILSNFTDNVSRETLDKGLGIVFRAPNSYTGEDVVEYHVHGGIAVIDGMLSALGRLEGHRMALPGEFTRRAFENGKMDLTEAEAVADLIHAQTSLQKQQALSQIDGGLSKIYNDWTLALTKILAYVEAELEFPDEDVPDDILETITPKIAHLRDDIMQHLDDKRRGERLRDGIRVAVIGAPNAGKSSLVNALAQRDVAIVSDIAGTTRDVIDVHLDVAGYPVILSDTAGLRPDQIDSNNDQDRIESEGIKRALKVALEADIRVILYDGTASVLDPHSSALEEGENVLAVINKADKDTILQHPHDVLRISVSENNGIDAFLEALTVLIQKQFAVAAEAPSLTRQRHRFALQECVDGLERCLQAPLPELSAEDLRIAIRAIGKVTGAVDVEDVLDVVFRDFCIGK